MHISTDFHALIRIAQHLRSVSRKTGYNEAHCRKESGTPKLWATVHHKMFDEQSSQLESVLSFLWNCVSFHLQHLQSRWQKFDSGLSDFQVTMRHQPTRSRRGSKHSSRPPRSRWFRTGPGVIIPIRSSRPIPPDSAHHSVSTEEQNSRGAEK